LTPHNALAAPYHRLSAGLVQAHRALAAAPEEAREVLDRLKVGNAPTYVVVCGPRPPDGMTAEAHSRSLWAKLRQGAVPGWLEPVSAGPAFAVYRVRP